MDSILLPSGGRQVGINPKKVVGAAATVAFVFCFGHS